MGSACFVVDEWLVHDLRGDNGSGARAEALNFLQTLHAKCDKIAFLVGGEWARKAYDLMKRSEPAVRIVSRYLQTEILLNSLKAVTLRQDDVGEVEEPLRALVPRKDMYLVETYQAVGADALITSDGRLRDALAGACETLKVRLRDEFLAAYVSGTEGGG